jgi:hypothetical protein
MDRVSAGDYYRQLRALYESQGALASLPLSHIWREGSVNMDSIRAALGADDRGKQSPPPVNDAPTPSIQSPGDRTSGTVVDMTRDEDTIIARSIDLSLEWYDRLFSKNGVSRTDFPPDVIPTGDQRRAAIQQQYPVVALGRFEHFHTVRLLERHCLEPLRTEQRRVLYVEIGAIYGALARILAPRHPELTYVFVDIPESLCVTYESIAAAFPSSQILLASKTGDVGNAVLRDYDFVFVPAVLFDELAAHEVDVFAGFHTFGEMTNKYIARYFRTIQEKIRPKYFVSRNRYLNFVSPNYFHRLSENMGSVLFDAGWEVLHWEVEPEVLSCPYVDTRRHPRYLEVVLRRTETPASAADVLDDVMLEGWTEIVSRFSNMMVNGYKPLERDRHVTGTLFKLWNSVRCRPGRGSLLVLLHYLDYLSADAAEFAEEWFFYGGLLRRLHEAAPDDSSAELLPWLERRFKSEGRAAFSPAPGFFLGATVPAEPLPDSVVRSMAYEMADIDIAAMTSPAAPWSSRTHTGHLPTQQSIAAPPRRQVPGVDHSYYRPRLLQLLSDWTKRGCRLAIFGVGPHTELLLSEVPELDCPALVGFIDSDRRLTGQDFHGRLIHPVAWANEHADVVLCSSFTRELEQLAVLDGLTPKGVLSHPPSRSRV